MCFIAFIHLTDCSTQATRSIVLIVVRLSSAGKTWIFTLSLTKVRLPGFLKTWLSEKDHLALYVSHPETQKKGMLNNRRKENLPQKWVCIISLPKSSRLIAVGGVIAEIPRRKGSPAVEAQRKAEEGEDQGW